MYPPVTFPPPPPTSNTRSSHERAVLVRSSRKLSKILGDVPRVSEDDISPVSSRPSTSRLDLTRTPTGDSVSLDTESTWHKRKPTHLPPLLKLPDAPIDVPDSPMSVTSPVYDSVALRCGSVLSIAPSIVSNAPSTATGSSTSDASSDATQRRTKLERLRRKLGEEVPATAVFLTTPHTATARTPRASSSKKTPRARSRSGVRQPDDARSITFSVSSDESVHTVVFSTRVRSPRSQRTNHVHRTGALPPVPSIPEQFRSERYNGGDNDDVGLIRPRQKMPAGSGFGGADFKAARRAKWEGKAMNGTAEPGELIEMVGFMH